MQQVICANMQAAVRSKGLPLRVAHRFCADSEMSLLMLSRLFVCDRAEAANDVPHSPEAA